MDYTLGKISYFFSDGAARIEVKGFCKGGKWFNLPADIEREFPPCGKIYAPGLKTDFPSFKQYDYICFDTCQENYNYSEGGEKDKYIFSQNAGGEAWQYPGAEILENITDENLCARPSIESKTPEELYFFREKDGKKYICGPLNAENKLAPVNNATEIMAWEYQEGDCIVFEGTKFLIAPDVIKNRKCCFKLDCMSKKQFITWVKEQLKVLQNRSSYTPKEMLQAIELLPANDELAVSRFKRLKDNIDLLITAENSVDELKSMPAFADKINEIIADHKEKFLADAQKDIQKTLDAKHAQLQQLEKEIDQKKDELQTVTDDYDLTIMTIKEEQNKIVADRERKLKEIENKYSHAEKSLISLQKNREKLLEDIRLQAEIFGGSNSSKQWTYPLEEIVHGEDSVEVSGDNWNSFIAGFNRSIPNICVCKDIFYKRQYCWQVDDIREGVFLAHISGNAVYQLCQPSPDWLSFKNFWDESLNVIWESAHANPDKWHFLLIENYNIALPECWGMPLWNMLEGKISLLPCAKTPQYPQNLRILFSLAPTGKETDAEDNSYALGLPTRVPVFSSSMSQKNDWSPAVWSIFSECLQDGLTINKEYYIPVVK